MSNGKKIILSGGALAKNVFWQVAGQTTIGTTAVFNGTILDQVAIVMNNSATLNGRALAQTAVTMIGNSVNDVQNTSDTTAPTFNLDLNNPSATVISDTNAVVDVNSSEKVTCRYNINQDANYESMLAGNTIDMSGTIQVYDLIGGTDYNLFVRCRDLAGNDSNGYKLYSFTTLGDTTTPVISLSSLTKTTTTAQLSVTTNEAVTCRRGTTDLNYDLLSSDGNVLITTSLGTGSGTISLSGLSSSTAYTFYVVCRDSNNNDSNASMTFTTDAESTGGGSSGGSGGGMGVPYAQTCTSFIYSDWSTCNADSQQTRTVVSSSPTNCINGEPVLTQECSLTQTDATGLVNLYTPGTANYYEQQRYNQAQAGLPLTYPQVTSPPTNPPITPTPVTPNPTTPTITEPTGPTGLFSGWMNLGEAGNLIVPMMLALLLVLVALGAVSMNARHDLEKAEQEKEARDKKIEARKK